eukprot:3749825-Pleurochrysis_carterae.AAC.1
MRVYACVRACACAWPLARALASSMPTTPLSESQAHLTATSAEARISSMSSLLAAAERAK